MPPVLIDFSARRSVLRDLLEVACKLLATADPFAVDKDLRRSSDAVFRFEGIHLLPAGKQVIVDVKPRSSACALASKPYGHSWVGQLHSDKDRTALDITTRFTQGWSEMPRKPKGCLTRGERFVRAMRCAMNPLYEQMKTSVFERMSLARRAPRRGEPGAGLPRFRLAR